MQLAQKISSLVMGSSKRSVSDFPCSERTFSEGTRSCTEVMSLVIEDWKSTYELIRQKFGQLSGFSPSNRLTHEGLDKRRFGNVPAWGLPRRIGGRDDIELWRGLDFLTCYLFSTSEFLSLCYIIARHLTFKLLKLMCNLADLHVFTHEANLQTNLVS